MRYKKIIRKKCIFDEIWNLFVYNVDGTIKIIKSFELPVEKDFVYFKWIKDNENVIKKLI